MEQNTRIRCNEHRDLFCRCTPAKGALVHCITNPISINLCANGILALGCRPVMVEHPQEVYDVTRSANALLLNLGSITDARLQSVKISARTAHADKIPFVLDAVGVGCSFLRRGLAREILHAYKPDMVKGNYSEICALCDDSYRTSGVDGEETLCMERVKNDAASLAKTCGCTVLASGKKDIISDGSKTVLIENGREILSHVTGTGCLLGAVAAALLTSGAASLDCAVAACGILEISAELVDSSVRCGSFPACLLDEMSLFRERREFYAEQLHQTVI